MVTSSLDRAKSHLPLFLPHGLAPGPLEQVQPHLLYPLDLLFEDTGQVSAPGFSSVSKTFLFSVLRRPSETPCKHTGHFTTTSSSTLRTVIFLTCASAMLTYRHRPRLANTSIEHTVNYPSVCFITSDAFILT